MDYKDIATRFPGAKKTGDGHSAKCLAHEDHNASLSIGKGEDGRTLLKCHAGCDTKQVVEVVGLEKRDLFPDGKETKPTVKNWKAEAEKYRRNRTPESDYALASIWGVPVAALALIALLGF